MTYAREATITHGAFTYKVRHADASTGLAMGARLANMAAPLVSGARKGASVERAIEYALSQPDLGANLQALAKAFAPFTMLVTAEGAELPLATVFEDHFAGRYDALLAWLIGVLKFDLSSFLAGLSTAAGALAEELPKAKSESESPTAAPKTG